MTARTPTHHQTVFALSHPSRTFEFLSPTIVKIAFPPNSTYRFPYHWHTSLQHGCASLSALKGRVQTYSATPNGGSGSTVFGPGTGPFKFIAGDHHYFNAWEKEEGAIALLEGDEELITLLRNICSATLDASAYPTLASTPLPVRLFYRLVGLISTSAQQWLCAAFLWAQIQMMNQCHGLAEMHGMINAPAIYGWLMLPFDWNAPPAWTEKIMWWSIKTFSMVVQGGCYLFGKFLLGMKPEYPDYTGVESRVTLERDTAKSGSEPLLKI